MESAPRTHATAFEASNGRGNGGDGGGGSGGGGGDGSGCGTSYNLHGRAHTPTPLCVEGGYGSVPRTHARQVRGRWFEWGMLTDLLRS